MTKIKFCGLSRECDIETANRLRPDYVGFVFAPASKRYISFERAKMLRSMLKNDIKAVGVFVNEAPETVAKLLKDCIIDIAQLHGDEDDGYITRLRTLTDKPIIKAFRISCERDVTAAENSKADLILLDSGAGTGKTFDWTLLQNINRPYFLAGGLDASNASYAVKRLKPYALDVSSGIETGGYKDQNKMAEFINVRKEITND